MIGHIPKTNSTFWQFINQTTVEKTKKGYKVIIPKIHNLDNNHSKYKIEEIINEKSLNGKISKLFFDKELMQFINDGGKIVIQTEEWVNKSLGRGKFEVILIHQSKEETVREWRLFYTYALEQILEQFFPWAEIGIDEEFYEENFDDSVYYVFPKQWIQTHEIYPFTIHAGEVGLYRLQLSLNSIGKAFLEIHDYLTEN